MDKLKPTATERRRQTRNDVYQYIFHSPEPVSKQQIAISLGISLPTVYQNLTELEQAGLVCVSETKESTGGRPPVAYTAVGDIRFAVGASVSAHHLGMLVSDLKQNVTAYDRMPLEPTADEDIISQLDQRLRQFIETNHLDTDRLLGVGVTMPGVFDAGTERLILSPTIRINNFRMSDMKKNFPYPLYFENDSTSGGNAEYLSRVPKGQKRDFVYLFLEYGIGGAIFVNGSPFYGASHRSAEFGHMCVEPKGRLCRCGKRGCLEAYCSALRFTQDLGITAEEFFQGLEDGNKEYAVLWDDVLAHLAVAANNLRMAFDCDVILGGFVSGYLEPYLGKLKGLAEELNTFGDNADYLKIGKYPKHAGMLGVAWHFTNQFIMGI